MSEKFRNKFRIASNRLRGFDYASAGAYFITIVTRNREHFFGEIVNDKMVLNAVGEMAGKYWREIPQHFPFVRLDEFIIMPNHIHGILWIDDQKYQSPTMANDTGNVVVDDAGDVVVDDAGDVETPNLGISTMHKRNENNKKSRNKNHKPEWKPGTIGVIINQYKRICTIKSRPIIPGFAWQSNYHDRIIRNNAELNRIRQYIMNNPKMWQRDSNHR